MTPWDDLKSPAVLDGEVGNGREVLDLEIIHSVPGLNQSCQELMTDFFTLPDMWPLRGCPGEIERESSGRGRIGANLRALAHRAVLVFSIANKLDHFGDNETLVDVVTCFLSGDLFDESAACSTSKLPIVFLTDRIEVDGKSAKYR